ncbi:MAG: twin-arginine translocation signal domain-containing protein, partial [Actinobacteria bacterium]|nr:twin-arginine translocation signal domain-containing protein [Actinomycetota bacterium]
MTASIDRRQFLKGAGTLLVATAAGGILLDVLLPGDGSPAAADIGAALPLGTPICVSISLEGGCDYLDTLVPVDNPWYFDATYGRGAMAVDPATTLPLAGQSSYALNKGLPYLANRWNTSNDVAFVLGIGEQNKQDFSHFDSIAFWQTADTTLLEPTGWLGRFNDLRHPALATASVSLGGVRKDTLGTTAPTLAVNDTSTFVYSLPGLD